jgi:hypothetical protein
MITLTFNTPKGESAKAVVIPMDNISHCEAPNSAGALSKAEGSRIFLKESASNILYYTVEESPQDIADLLNKYGRPMLAFNCVAGKDTSSVAIPVHNIASAEQDRTENETLVFLKSSNGQEQIGYYVTDTLADVAKKLNASPSI